MLFHLPKSQTMASTKQEGTLNKRVCTDTYIQSIWKYNIRTLNIRSTYSNNNSFIHMVNVVAASMKFWRTNLYIDAVESNWFFFIFNFVIFFKKKVVAMKT